MTIESQNYKLEILEYAVNQSINCFLPNSSEDALSAILDISNEVVWKVATDIYTKSGHQVDFLFVKEILNLRTESLQNRIAEESRINAKLEAQRLAREIEEERIRKEKEAERLAKFAEQERIEKEQKEKEQKKLQEFKQANPDFDIDNYLEIFTRIKNIIVEELELEEERITSDATLNVDLGIGIIYYSFNWDSSSSNFSDNSDLDGVEFIMAIEKEFDIEISDEESESLLSGNISQLVNFILQKI